MCGKNTGNKLVLYFGLTCGGHVPSYSGWTIHWYYTMYAEVTALLKGMFIVCCNTAALAMPSLLIYCRSTQGTAPQVHFPAVLQCSSWCRDGNQTTATYRNADAVKYERSIRSVRTSLQLSCATLLQCCEAVSWCINGKQVLQLTTTELNAVDYEQAFCHE